jgi:integrase
MSRRKAILIYPKLNDRNGDLSKKWYIEWGYRIPGKADYIRERKYNWEQIPDRAERDRAISEFIEQKRVELESGAHLKNRRTVYEDELEYNTVAKLYGRQKESVVTIRTYLSEFLEHKKKQVNAKSYQTYQSKMRTFCAYVAGANMDETDVANITTEFIVAFTESIAHLSRASVKKYIQNLYSFFDWLKKVKRVIPANPVEDIPAIGRVVDCAAVPLQADDRERLKHLIRKNDPQLWLACEIQYYCAIRPGTEIRLMKIGMIDFDRYCFRIPAENAKNNTTEIVAIPEQLIREMKETYRINSYDKDLYLFGKNGCPGGEPFGKNTLRNRFNGYRDALGLSGNYKFYSWKHTGAIEASENGMSIYDLRDHLRHKSLLTTETYLKKRTSRAAKFVRNNFPSI